MRMSYAVHIQDLVKRYGDFFAVDHVSLDIENGEFFTLLGPSGCGKTTLLRMIAGFNEIDGGTLSFDENRVNDLPAYRRNIGMVFQNYAVFPHMTVAENIAYGLKARGISGSALEGKVRAGMELMRIEALGDRSPAQLSGGQQQRVALARAIVIEPDVLLMDEPLSNLDAKLRLEMRIAIRRIQRDLGITTIYVTHDQEEALAISDRIAVMNAGRVMQLGDPETIYQQPSSVFVANFIGTSNFIPGTAGADGVLALGEVRLARRLGRAYEGAVQIAVRPEHIVMENPREGLLTARIVRATFLGTHYEYEAQLSGGTQVKINAYQRRAGSRYDEGDEVGLGIAEEHMNVYTETGEEALL